MKIKEHNAQRMVIKNTINFLFRPLVIIDRIDGTITFRDDGLFSKKYVVPLSQAHIALVACIVGERMSGGGYGQPVKVRTWELYFEIDEHGTTMVGDTLQQYRKRVVIDKSEDEVVIKNLASEINKYICSE